MAVKIKFGTDGWRAVIAEDYTFDNVRRAAQGYASYMLEKGNRGKWIIVGYDKRFGSEFFAAATAEVLAGNGYCVYLTDSATPTPVIAFAVVDSCAGCMHRPVFYALRRVFKDGIYPSDIGCYTLGLQMGAVDTTICMGASIPVGSGMFHGGEERDIVCTIGDSTFLHTGIQGLLNAVYNDARMTVVILDNRITAMTGHQPNPTTGLTACGTPAPAVSLEAICRACGVFVVETVDPYDLVALIAALKEVKERPGVKVVTAKQYCVITARRAGIRRGRYSVDPELCTGSNVCIASGCPAIERSDEKARINELCSGCAVCALLCPAGAIRKEASK